MRKKKTYLKFYGNNFGQKCHQNYVTLQLTQNP